jgi:adenosylmethionine-8-amino-7-oxononanoate aminotransferase
MEAWSRRDSQAVWHPFTPTPHLGPRVFFSKASGAYVFDQTGKRYFDATSSWWCNIHGHCHPRLVAALADQAATLDQVMFAPHTHGVGIELAERLTKKLGPPFTKVFYSDDGSTAVETALKVAAQYWRNRGDFKRNRFLSVERGYHGDTLGAVSVGAISEFFGHFSGLAAGSFRATAPYCYRCPLNLTFPGCEVACLDETRRYVELHHSEIAALIIEPLILGAGGMIIYPEAYLEKIGDLCREFGILVIYDEVFTGFGRTGTFFAADRRQTKPDIICLSKGITSGMLPLGATVVSEAIYAEFGGSAERTFYHGHTFTGNPLACRIAIESLNIFEQDAVLERNKTLESLMTEQGPRFRALERVGNVRQQGMIWALEVVVDQKSKQLPVPANGPGWSIAAALWENGVWVRPLGNVLYIVPPYASSVSDLQGLFSMLYSELQNSNHFGV